MLFIRIIIDMKMICRYDWPMAIYWRIFTPFFINKCQKTQNFIYKTFKVVKILFTIPTSPLSSGQLVIRNWAQPWWPDLLKFVINIAASPNNPSTYWFLWNHLRHYLQLVCSLQWMNLSIGTAQQRYLLGKKLLNVQ